MTIGFENYFLKRFRSPGLLGLKEPMVFFISFCEAIVTKKGTIGFRSTSENFEQKRDFSIVFVSEV